MLKLVKKPWPWYGIGEPSPADWGIGMTVCIASLCYGEKCFAAVEDSMLSTVDMSRDSLAVKHKSIGNKWIAMLAGNDVSPAVPIIKEVRDVTLASEKETMDDIVSAFQKAFRRQIAQRAETTVLSRFDIDMAEFRKNGLACFGSELFTRLIYEIEQISLDLTFLVFGFEGEDGHIFTIHGRGEVSYYDIGGFWAIGTGQTSALATLFATQNPIIYSSLSAVIYILAKAKFNSETALGVGKNTTGIVLHADTSRYVIHNTEMNGIKELWKKQRQPDCPLEADQIVSEVIRKSKEQFTL